MASTDEFVVDVSHDWRLACDVQRAFMQAPRTGGRSVEEFADYGGRCRQVRELGGDCFNFIPAGAGRLGLLVADASGKGLAAALMIANVQSSLRTAATFIGDDLAELIRVVNHQAFTCSPAERYATLFYGIFDGGERTLRYVNAGHNPPVIVRAGGRVEWLETSGAPVGMFADSVYEEMIVGLEPGDLLLAFTDGVVEATNQAGQEWGTQGLVKAAVEGARRVQGAGELVNAIFDSMDEFSVGQQTDDATMAVVRTRYNRCTWAARASP
jgi:sigma-B regulation protein RsbU (phosphoserine phosphatase)